MRRKTQLAIKRAFDFLLAVMGLVLLCALFLCVPVAIILDSRGRIFYRQDRIGLRGVRFQMLKFRTMVERADEMGAGLYVSSDDARITRVGRFLRRFSIDELPQLFHVLSGRMSLIGPRPGLPYQLELYTPGQHRRLLMRPGITGWSQIHGRNLLSWPERLDKDAWYVDHFSLWLDAQILWRTFGVWLSGEGLYAPREKFFFSDRDDVPSPADSRPCPTGRQV